MRITVLGTPNGWAIEELRRVAGGEHCITIASLAELHSSVGRDVTVRSGTDALEASDAVLVRAMPPGSLEQVVFRMDALLQLESRGVRVINPPKAIEAAIDKYLATARLHAAGLPTPRTFACQTAADALDAFGQLGGRAVLKPIFGGEGRGVTLLEDEAVAARSFTLLERLGAVILLQEFLEHEGADLRLLVVGEGVLGMRRVNQLDWRTNVSRGATPEPLEVTDDLAELAHRAAAAVGAPLAGVDVLPTRDGRQVVLEVNTSPGWQALQQVNDADVAALVLGLLVPSH